jgi:hypothetical protein
MDHETNKQEPSSKEGGQVKAGDKVWVLCEVVMVYNRSLYMDIRHDGAVFEAKASDCRPVEPSVVKDSFTTESNDPEILGSSSEPLQVGDAVVIVERSHKWRGVRGRIVSVSESNEYPLEFISDCGKRLGYFPSSSMRKIDQADPINPLHYKQGGIECIDAIKAATGDGFIGYVWGNVLKYLWRWPKKGGVDDLKKARWYLDRLIKEVGE